MKCQKCNGNGVWIYETDDNYYGHIDYEEVFCECCDGTGKKEKEKVEEVA